MIVLVEKVLGLGVFGPPNVNMCTALAWVLQNLEGKRPERISKVMIVYKSTKDCIIIVP